jgi:hypothetical protein
MAMSHSREGLGQRAGAVGVYLVPKGRYASRVNTVQAYGDVNREVSFRGRVKGLVRVVQGAGEVGVGFRGGVLGYRQGVAKPCRGG